VARLSLLERAFCRGGPTSQLTPIVAPWEAHQDTEVIGEGLALQQTARTLRASWSALATFLIVAAALFAMAGPAEARILQLQPADESETPTLDFTDDQALFAIGTSDFLGGQICVVSSAITDVGDGSLNCDDAQAWGSPNQIITLGTFITPIESPSLVIGTWRLLGDGGSLPGQDALSLPFTVTPCIVCNPRIGAQSVQYYKDIAARMAPPISDMCTWFNYMNLVGSVATGLRSGATLALNTVGSPPLRGARGCADRGRVRVRGRRHQQRRARDPHLAAGGLPDAGSHRYLPHAGHVPGHHG
jgi:hypothetical protein